MLGGCSDGSHKLEASFLLQAVFSCVAFMADTSRSYAQILSGLFLSGEGGGFDALLGWTQTCVISDQVGMAVRLPSQLQRDRAVMSCRQHGLTNILMMTTASRAQTPHTLVSLCTLCTTNVWEPVNESVFPLYNQPHPASG